MSILHLVDAFASRPFTGNPAAVCLLEEPASEQWMQQMAFELGFSETAYVWPHGKLWSLRWFTPMVEVDLCGHATLASAHTLWSLGRGDPELRFRTKSGVLTCVRDGELVRMDFPRRDVVACEPPEGLLQALGCQALGVYQAGADHLVEVASAAQVLALTPDHRALRGLKIRGVMVTAPSDEQEYDFVSRVFAPGAGIDEDPVTGSAHCALGPFWGARLNKTKLRAFQASMRGGSMSVEVEAQRVVLVGRALTVLRGQLTG